MANNPRSDSRATVDIAYDACTSGAIGGSVVAIFFLIVDVLNGQAFFSPSLMGSVLFLGTAAEAVVDVRLDMVAYYTVVHCTAFLLLGAAVTLLIQEVELHTRHPVLVLLLLFAILEAGFAVSASLLMPGVIERLGAVQVVAVNLLAAGGMGLFLLSPYHYGLRQDPGHATNRGS